MTSKIIFKAIGFANNIHRGQFRKSTPIPKLVHLIGVMNILLEYGCSENIVIAGLLHDSLEDTGLESKDLVKKFGKKVAELVKGASEKDKLASWEDRKLQAIEYLKSAPLDVLLIVCADKIDNLRFTAREHHRLGERVWERFNRGKKQQKWYFQSLIDVLDKRLIEKEPGKSMVLELVNEYNKVFGKEL